MLEFIIIKCIIVALLIYISFVDIRQRIIPNLPVVLILILSTAYFFLAKGLLTDYFFYLLIISIPLLIISLIIESLNNYKYYIFDYLAIVISVIASLLIPAGYKMKFLIFCVILLIFSILINIFDKRKNVTDEQASGIGGGDIKLFAALGPILGINNFTCLFLSFLLALTYMKIKKEKDIFLAPFITIGFIMCLYFI